MADTKALPVFSYTDDVTQLVDLRKYLNARGASLKENGPEALADNLLEIVKQASLVGSAREADMILQSISSVFVGVPEDRCEEIVLAFCDQLTPTHFKGVGWHSNAGAAVRVLSNLFRGFARDPKIQQRVFITLLEMIREARLVGDMDVSQDTLNEYFKTWNTDTAGKRAILRQLNAALLADNRADQAAKVMIALLSMYTDADAASALEDARECVRTAVVDPKSYSFDHIHRLTAVQQLEKSDPAMHQALQLFATGTLKDYQKFVAAHPAFVSEKLRVNEGILVKKMRLLTLMSIAEKNQTVPLALLSFELAIADVEELEEFIIEAIQVNAISGKVNEQSGTLIVSSFQHRSFGREEWKQLHDRIKSLIVSVRQSHENILTVNKEAAEMVN